MMTIPQQIMTVALLIIGTVLTRFLPFMIFREGTKTPPFIQYISKYLPSAVFAMLVVYCLKDVQLLEGNHGLPEIIAIVITAGLHLWKRQTLLSVFIGTACYMLLIHLI